MGPQAKSLEFVPYCVKAELREESAEKRGGEEKKVSIPKEDGHKLKLCPRWMCVSGAHT